MSDETWDDVPTSDDGKILRKTSFRDSRMKEVSCPLCGSKLDEPSNMYDFKFGETATWQCGSCGMVMDIINMVDDPTEFLTKWREWGGIAYPTSQSIARDYAYFPGMPYESSVKAVAIEKEMQKLEREQRKKPCEHCETLFIPSDGAKSRLTMDFCPACRKDDVIRPLIDQKIKDEKAAAKAAARKAAKRTTRNSRKKKAQ